MFVDPQSITLAGTATSFPRVGTGPSSSVYKTADGVNTFTISHTAGKRSRKSVRLDFSKNAADPLQPATNRPYTGSAYLVVDAPLFGYTVAEQKVFVDGLTAWLTASSGANVTKVLGGES